MLTGIQIIFLEGGKLMMERLRLRNFNPERVAPNFLNFLHQKGQVEIGEENEEIARAGISNQHTLHGGLRKTVKLNGQEIGKLECYIDPPAVVYEGRLPDVQRPESRGRRWSQSFPQSVVDQNGIVWTYVKVIYHGKHPKADTEGRSDGWTKIPLP